MTNFNYFHSLHITLSLAHSLCYYSARPLQCVLSNTNGQVFTYTQQGSVAHYEGPGDMHNPSYDHIGNSIDLTDYIIGQSTPLTMSFTAVNLDITYLNYTLTVYPTDAYRNHYVTNQALIDALLVGFLFLFCFVAFGLYDCCIQRCQQIVMERAVKTTAVLGSLYPDTVREQIINDTGVDEYKHCTRKAFLRKSVAARESANSSPWASQYPNCRQVSLIGLRNGNRNKCFNY
eukprot:Nitzschia sp. Nitz4//scaffold214_size40253//25810//26632//NITZ4_007590-RA/size40253-processed-gene-0.73-mRNA-1//1//CDS//3329542108//4255//frame0